LDFLVYYRAAKSFIAGRTDVYSSTFSSGPPMIYLYPPLFLLVIFPLGWLSLANACGVWFAAQALATAGAVRGAYLLWRPRNPALHAWTLAALAGPYIILVLRYGNVHLIVLALMIHGVVAWGRDKRWVSSTALALGGAVKPLPLFLVTVFVARREWAMVLRIALISCVLWALPALYFGPRKTVSLYRSWWGVLLRDRAGFEKQRPLDQSLAGATERWFTHVDYSGYRDRDYPEANFAELGASTARIIALAASLALLGASLWMCAKLRGPVHSVASSDAFARERRIATTASVFVSAQLLIGPYTHLIYFSALVLFGMTLGAIFSSPSRISHVLLGIATLNLLLFAIPGAKAQRALQAGGAFTLIVLALWGLAMYGGCLVSRTGADGTMPSAPTPNASPQPIPD
jgi:hypothetical protein